MIRNLNDIINNVNTFGQVASDFIAKVIGSWKFIISQTCFFVIWILYNLYSSYNHFDPYPFILMNLVLSFEAAFLGPIIMMSQNREEEKDRIKAEHNYLINSKTEHDTEMILEQLKEQNDLLMEIFKNNVK